ncbi:MAG: hypothetical protein II634_05235, partial [Lachnospiraceae bacterium]|nr:hypothetical protein [Lachnospiraceae bacterium]
KAIDAAISFVGDIDDNIDEKPDFEDVKAEGDPEKVKLGEKTLYAQIVTASVDGEKVHLPIFLEMYKDRYIIYFMYEITEDSGELAIETIIATTRLGADAYKGINGNPLGQPTPTGAEPTGTEPTPTEAPDPTPTDEPTPTPTPTEAATPTPTATPTPAAATTQTFTHSKMKFTIDLPGDAEIEEFETGVYAETDYGMLYLSYKNNYNDGIVLNAADFYALAGSDANKLADLLYLDGVEFLSGAESTDFTINGVKASTVPLAHMIWDADDEDFGRGCGRFYIYECKDAIGVYYGWYIIDGAKYDGSMTTEQKNTQLSFDAALQSLKQTGSPLVVDYHVYEDRMPDGTGIVMVYEEGAIKGHTYDGNSKENSLGYKYYYNDEKNGYLDIQHFKPKQSTVEAYFENMKNSLSDPKYHFSATSEFQGRFKWTHWTLSYEVNGNDYLEETYVSMDENGELWFVLLFGLKDKVEEQDTLIEDVLWSLNTHYNY